MLETLNASNIGMFLRCGESARRRYIMGEVIPPGVSLGIGISVDEAATVNFKQKIETHEDMPEEDLLDAARDKFRDTFKDGIYLTRSEQSAKDNILEDGLKDALRGTSVVRQELAPTIQPLAAQEYLYADVGLDVPITGYIDYRTKRKIHDLKATRKSWNDQRAVDELQTPGYHLLSAETGIALPVQYDVVVTLKTKTKLQQFMPDVTKKMVESFVSLGAYVLRMVNAGMFPPTLPSNWWCSERFCGYWRTCGYVGNASKKQI